MAAEEAQAMMEGEWEGEWDEENYDEEGDYEWGEDDWDGDDWDEDWDEDDEDWDDDEEEEEGILQRCAMGGPNRQFGCGIHTIEIYHPQFYFKQTEMEEWDSQPHRYGPAVIGKYTKGVGQVEARFPTDDEDPISFAMTVVHRVVERMNKWGFNETAKFHPEGKTLNPWNAIGRIDIGSESLVDRSKSMKTYVMDLFERYGDGEQNIEGVDMYNACYGGQAAGLCVLSWCESDRWDGRYGCAIATDISDAHSSHLFTVGAACTATLYFPDAPAAHHSYRASCIMHRFDFFKPVGWKVMGPVVDGKYSIDAYMTCIDLCYEVLRKKMNGVRVFSLTDYNVFHTGGGFHIVKKSFERMCRADDPNSDHASRAILTTERLIPSVHLLKIIGPCHTVSSFLNISSVIMSQWDVALGKVLVVFTYGSGCASSMYQLRFDEIAWMRPLSSWKIEFYRDAIYMYPSTFIHDVYVMTWMKFGFYPQGRKLCNIDPWKYQLDVYYLMEIDKWGRRFFHRGGIIAPSLASEFKLRVDKAEGRPKRDRYEIVKDKPAEKKETLDDEWRQIEYDLTYDVSLDSKEEVLQDAYKTHRNNQKLTIIQRTDAEGRHPMMFECDGQPHKYYILGSWSNYQKPEEMEEEEDGQWQFTVTVGENGYEEFLVFQDLMVVGFSRMIWPAKEKSWKSQPCVGPWQPRGEAPKWRIETRDFDETPEEDLGRPGDQYLVTFSWKPGTVKNVEWDKLPDERDESYPIGKYYLQGSWNCYDKQEMMAGENGHHYVEAVQTLLGLNFMITRNGDDSQLIMPEMDPGEPLCLEAGGSVAGPDKYKEEEKTQWSIPGGAPGDKFLIDFHRNPAEPTQMSVTWSQTGSGEKAVPDARWFIVRPGPGWPKSGNCIEMTRIGMSETFTGEFEIGSKFEIFKIQKFKRVDMCIHPDKKDGVSQQQSHKVLGPDVGEDDQYWAIGKAAADKAKVGDIFQVTYDIPGEKVTWKKKG